MHQKSFVLCSATAVLAIAVACSKSPATPVAPASTLEVAGDAAPDGSTLKVPAPTPVSPINNAQLDSLVLVASRVTGKFNASLNPSYQFEIRRSGAALSACSTTVAPGSGSTVSYTPSCPLEFDTAHTWRVRAVTSGAVGPWSAEAAFRTQSGGYINSSPEVFDPLINGKTVGNASGVQFLGTTGLEFTGPTSLVTYALPATLQAGEFSAMVKGIDEGSPGDKTKVFTMQEGTNDITDNDYRMTVEKRGISYSTPGAVTWRIILGDAYEHARIIDGDRIGLEFSDERWYFWKFTWGARTTLEVRENSPTGRVVYQSSRGTSGFAYRPVPHYAYLGSPVGRAGAGDASIPGAIYKNVWISARPRPTFPGE